MHVPYLYCCLSEIEHKFLPVTPREARVWNLHTQWTPSPPLDCVYLHVCSNELNLPLPVGEGVHCCSCTHVGKQAPSLSETPQAYYSLQLFVWFQWVSNYKSKLKLDLYKLKAAITYMTTETIGLPLFARKVRKCCSPMTKTTENVCMNSVCNVCMGSISEIQVYRFVCAAHPCCLPAQLLWFTIWCKAHATSWFFPPTNSYNVAMLQSSSGTNSCGPVRSHNTAV